PNLPAFRANHTRDIPAMLFARDFIHHRHPEAGRRLTVYSQFGRVEYVWIELKANSYFDWWQAGGFIFRRQTAVEGQRRAHVVGPFEVERFREFEVFIDDDARRDIRRFFAF